MRKSKSKERFGQQTPRRWGWGTPLKKRTATRITVKLKLTKILSTSYLALPKPRSGGSMTPFRPTDPDHAAGLFPFANRLLAKRSRGASDHCHRKTRGNGPRLCAERQPQRLRRGCACWGHFTAFGHSGVLRLVLRTQPRSGGRVKQLSHWGDGRRK